MRAKSRCKGVGASISLSSSTQKLEYTMVLVSLHSLFSAYLGMNH